MAHVSHAYKNMDMARERISLIMELMAMLLWLQMTFSLATADVVWAILESTSGLDPSSNTIVPRYLKTDGLQFLVVYGNVSSDAIGAVCHQLGLLCTDLHAICCGGLFKVIFSTWPALALVQLGCQCRRQNLNL